MPSDPVTAPSARDVVRALFPPGTAGLFESDWAIGTGQVVELMEAHAAAAVEAAARRVAELLERERNAARLEVMLLQEHRSELDCSYAGAFGESDGASHCPAAKPCQRCTLERERDEARAERDFQQERARVSGDLREKSVRRAIELERERDEAQARIARIKREYFALIDDSRALEARIVELTRERDEARAIAAEFMHKQTAEIERNRTRAPWIDDAKGGE